jgi:NADPH:quinone reductase-like Zn-dependent oxidoreductase/acyl carrier protein
VFVLSGIALDRALMLRQDRPTRLRIEYRPETTAFVIHSLSGQEWVRHVSGKVAHQAHFTQPAPLDLDAIHARCQEWQTGDAYYRDLLNVGYEYGDNFQGVREVWFGASDALDSAPTEALFRLTWPCNLPIDTSDYVTHPAVIDGYFNGVLAVLLRRARRTWIPVRTAESVVYRHPGQKAWAYMQLVVVRDEVIELDLTIVDEQGTICVTIRGMQYRALGNDAKRAQRTDVTFEERWQTQALPETPVASATGRRCVVMTECETLGAALVSMLKDRGTEAELATADIRNARTSVQGLGPSDELVYLQRTPRDSAECGVEILNCAERLLTLLRTLASVGAQPRLWLVTRGVHALGAHHALPPAQAPLWGFGRVIANEMPALRVRLVDLQTGNQAEWGALATEILSNSDETEIALQDEQRCVRRVQPLALTENGHTLPFRLALRTPGTLDALYFEALPTLAPAAGQVQIAVEATGLNFKDVVKTLNLIDEVSLAQTYAGRTLGFECAGRITAVGPGVEGFNVGDEVMALAQHCFATSTVTEAAMVVRKPERLSFAQAAASPVVYMTAYAALLSFGRLQRGERVLIHTAAGGVGQAALQLARCIGAEIYATAGSEEKRAWLRSQGVVHVSDSRSLAFVSEILEATHGKGVDLVLNTLPARTLPGSISLLRPRGRLVDLSNFYGEGQIDLRPFQKGLSVIAFDLDQLMRSDPEFISRLFSDTMSFVFEHGLPPPPTQSFPISRVQDAFRHLAQAQHIGKVVVTLDATEQVQVDATTAQLPALPSEATYLVTGGTSGFGLATTQWLAARGARHLVLLSRRGLTTPEAMLTVAELQRSDVTVKVLHCDASDFDALKQALDTIQAELPPLRGIIHAATVYADGVIEQLTQEQFQRVLQPKAIGAWHLHQLSAHLPLDFFVLYSSIAVTIGNPGQANYAAANTWLDCLATYRRSLGLPALSVAFGAIAEVGYLAREQAIGARLEQSGVELLSPAQALMRLGVLMQLECAHGIVCPLDWQRASSRLPALRSPRFEQLVRRTDDTTPGELSWADEMAQCEPSERARRLATRLGASAARILGVAATDLDVETPLTRLGLDSLLAVELSQQLGQRFGIELSSMRLLSGDSLARIAQDQVATLFDKTPPAVSAQREAPGTNASPAPLPPVSPEANNEQTSPLSFQQVPLWQLEQKYPGRGFYNLPTLVRFTGPLDAAQLQQAFHALTLRHETLRMRVEATQGAPCMRFAQGADLPWRVEDLQRQSASEREQILTERWTFEQVAPFDLAHEPPVRARLLLLSPSESALIVVLHHLAVDGASFPIFFTELYQLYQALQASRPPALPELTVRYSDFARGQREHFTGPTLLPWLEQWRQLLPAGVSTLPLPYDKQRPKEATCSGERFRFSVPAERTTALRTLAQQEQSTLFMVLLAALGALVQRVTGASEFCLGTFVANRTQPGLRSLVGCFINALPIRIDLRQEPSFRQALERVRSSTLAAQQLAELPFELLRANAVLERAPQVVLILHSELEASTDHRVEITDGLTATHREGYNQGAKRDWTFHLFDTPLGLTGYLEYDSDVFEAGSALRIVESYCNTLECVVAEPDAPVNALATTDRGQPVSRSLHS